MTFSMYEFELQRRSRNAALRKKKGLKNKIPFYMYDRFVVKKLDDVLESYAL